MKNMTATVMSDCIAPSVAASAHLAQRSVRVLAPFGARGPQVESVLRTDGVTFPRSGHVPWSPPV